MSIILSHHFEVVEVMNSILLMPAVYLMTTEYSVSTSMILRLNYVCYWDTWLTSSGFYLSVLVSIEFHVSQVITIKYTIRSYQSISVVHVVTRAHTRGLITATFKFRQPNLQKCPRRSTIRHFCCSPSRCKIRRKRNEGSLENM